jgi:hypothetical protein
VHIEYYVLALLYFIVVLLFSPGPYDLNILLTMLSCCSLKAEVDFAKNAKHAKRLARSKEDYGEQCSEVARRHTGPGMLSSIFFVILLRILGAEHKGNVMALMPFVPFNFLTRITARGLDWGDVASLEGTDVAVKQATSFLFIYLLSGLSVKYFINKAFGTQPPPGADKGILTVMESPQGQKMMKSMGIDPDELK